MSKFMGSLRFINKPKKDMTNGILIIEVISHGNVSFEIPMKRKNKNQKLATKF